MKVIYYNIKAITVFFMTILFLSACNSTVQNKENTSAKNETSKEEEIHEEEEEAIAVLTEEQVINAGVQLGSIQMKELTATIKANGVLKVPNSHKANATSLYAGVIKGLNVQIGDYVKKGQVIATIANPQFIQLQEEYLSIYSKITFAEQELARQRELFEGNAGAKKNLQSATAELNSLRTRRAALQQQIQLMGINPASLSNTNLQSTLVVTSPLNGTVSNVFAKIGSYADVSFPIIEIIDNSALHLDLYVYEKDLPQIKIGQTIHFTLTNNPSTEYDATVFNIGSSFENDSKTIAVHCRLKGKQIGLIDGMNITGIVSLNSRAIAAVPNDAIVNADGKYYIYVQTDKKPEDHHDEGEDVEEGSHSQDNKPTMNFEKIEVLKGVSELGYTGIVGVKDIPADAKIVVKGAFFVNAKLSNVGEHEH